MSRNLGTLAGVVLFVTALAAMWAVPETRPGVAAVALAIPAAVHRATPAALIAVTGTAIAIAAVWATRPRDR